MRATSQARGMVDSGRNNAAYKIQVHTLISTHINISAEA